MKYLLDTCRGQREGRSLLRTPVGRGLRTRRMESRHLGGA